MSLSPWASSCSSRTRDSRVLILAAALAALAALAAVSTVAAAQVPAASSYDPVQAGEVPPGYYQSVPRGMIRAVYAPEVPTPRW